MVVLRRRVSLPAIFPFFRRCFPNAKLYSVEKKTSCPREKLYFAVVCHGCVIFVDANQVKQGTHFCLVTTLLTLVYRFCGLIFSKNNNIYIFESTYPFLVISISLIIIYLNFGLCAYRAPEASFKITFSFYFLFVVIFGIFERVD